MSGTIADWERDRFSVEALNDIAELPEIEEPPVTTGLLGFTAVQTTVCLQSRMTAGLGVQLLWAPESGETFITLALAGKTETYEVEPEHAADAFVHPYCYGGTLVPR